MPTWQVSSWQPRQMVHPMATIASVELPSQENPLWMAPPCRSSQLMMLNVGSKIHIQAIVDSAVGTMNGSSRKARTRFLPRKLWSITSAMPRPPLSFRMVVTMV